MKKLVQFFHEGIWLLNPEQLSPLKSVAIKYLKILYLSWQGFVADHCSLRASALTLYTLLSIVPVIAMLFGIAKGFGFEKKLEEKIIEQVPEQDTMMLQILDFAQNLLANTQGGLVAGIGIAVLFWSVLKVISNIEDSFNHIWKIKRNRSLSRKLSDYLSLMLLAPILLIISSSISVYVSSQITVLLDTVQLPDTGSYAILWVLNYLPLVIIWGLFSFTFIFMPNTRVEFKSGLIAGVVTGTIYQLVQSAYVSLQIGVSSYNAIYGSFAALPLFIIWLQIAWLIVLFGSEIAFFHQNFVSFRYMDKFSNLSFSVKKILALQITQLIVQNFSGQTTFLTSVEISRKLALPISVVAAILNVLLESRIISAIKVDENFESCFQPARDPSLLTVASVIAALEKNGTNSIPHNEEFEYFAKVLQTFEMEIKQSSDNVLLKEMVKP